MDDWAGKFADIRRRVAERVDDIRWEVQRWQQRAEERLPRPDVAVLEEPRDPTDAPADAPRQLRDVAAQVEAGEVSWESVMSGAIDDEGGRAVSLWMDRRLQQLEQAGRLARRGMSMDDACAEVTGRPGR
ncbi:hypothetical protein Asp14428_33050 [Actinoplanes sp. NBRC 14428]|nr:hypothetical protein Asp14428_33050 [Actinoplanes sp. NBRC 14428]